MRAVEITVAFDGYPDGILRSFRVGDLPTDLDEAYAAMLVGKGLARDVIAATAEPDPEPAAHDA